MIRSSTKVLSSACVKRWVLNPALNCPRLMDDEWRCGGTAFQTAGTATWNLCKPSCVLIEGQACHGILPNKDLPDHKCWRLRCRHCWSRQDSAHRHSQTQRLQFWTVVAVTLAVNEALREEPAGCVRICQHQRPNGQPHSGPSEVYGWLVKRHCIEGCVTEQ